MLPVISTKLWPSTLPTTMSLRLGTMNRSLTRMAEFITEFRCTFTAAMTGTTEPCSRRSKAILPPEMFPVWVAAIQLRCTILSTEEWARWIKLVPIFRSSITTGTTTRSS